MKTLEFDVLNDGSTLNYTLTYVPLHWRRCSSKRVQLDALLSVSYLTNPNAEEHSRVRIMGYTNLSCVHFDLLSKEGCVTSQLIKLEQPYLNIVANFKQNCTLLKLKYS